MNKNLSGQNNIELNCLKKVRESVSLDVCFGVSEENYEDLKIWLESAVPNKKSSEFPDFLFEGGIIEHFSVTSSFEGRKGSKQNLLNYKQKASAIFC